MPYVKLYALSTYADSLDEVRSCLRDRDHEPSVEQEAIALEERTSLLRAVSRLPSRERGFLEARYGLGDTGPMSLAEIGRREGLSRERVRQICVRATIQLRRTLCSSPD